MQFHFIQITLEPSVVPTHFPKTFLLILVISQAENVPPPFEFSKGQMPLQEQFFFSLCGQDFHVF